MWAWAGPILAQPSPKKREKEYVGPPVDPTRLGRVGSVLAQSVWLGRVQPNLYLIIIMFYNII